MKDNIKFAVSAIEDNKGEVTITNEEWISYYNQLYEVNFSQISGDIKMHGFRKGNIPSILLEIKYPYLVEEANQRSIFTVIQMTYIELLKIHPNAKIKNYRVDDKTKNLILNFSIQVSEETPENVNKEEIIEKTKEKKKKVNSQKNSEKSEKSEKKIIQEKKKECDKIEKKKVSVQSSGKKIEKTVKKTVN